MMIYLFNVSVALFAGLMMTRVLKALHLHFPDVTAFLLSGLLIGPYGIGRLGIPGLGFADMEQVETLSVLSDAALGFIAFSIGNEFRVSKLRHIGRQAVITGLFEACCATVVVDAVLLALHFSFGLVSLPAAITLGAIAAATAPAATLMVVRQYKAHGKVTEILLPVVALDDAIGLILFAVSFGIAQAIHSGQMELLVVIVTPLLEIAASLLLGAALGVVFTRLERLFYSNTNRLNLTIMFVVLSVAFSSLEFPVGAFTLAFSPLLVCMMLGMVFCNLCPRSGDMMSRADQWTAPVFALFFILSGAELELGVFRQSTTILVGAFYIVFRCVGKYFGAAMGTAVTHAAPEARKYLGITLFPQAGVALGMSAQAACLGNSDGLLIRNIVLFGVFVYELVGPMMTRWALIHSGDIQGKPENKTTHARFNLPKDQVERWMLYREMDYARRKAIRESFTSHAPEQNLRDGTEKSQG